MVSFFGASILVASLSATITPPVTNRLAQCAPRAAMLYHLAKNFDERPAWQSRLLNGLRVEITVSKIGNWTLLITPPDKNSCIVASGQDWLPAPTADPVGE